MRCLASVVLIVLFSCIHSFSIREIDLPLEHVNKIVCSQRIMAVAADNGVFIQEKRSRKWHFFTDKSTSGDIYRNKSAHNRCLLKNFVINDLCLSSGKLWLATDDGVAVYNTYQHKWERFPLVFKEKVIESIEYYDDHLYIGVRGSGLICYNVKTSKKKSISSNDPIYGRCSARYINDICYDEYRDHVMVASQRTGLWYYSYFLWRQRNEKNSFLLTDTVNCIDTSQQYIWIGTSHGLYAYNEKECKKIYTVKDNLSSNKILSLHCVGDTVYVGTASGFSVISDMSVKPYSHEYGFENEKITAVFYDHSVLWAGTSSGKLYKIGL